MAKKDNPEMSIEEIKKIVRGPAQSYLEDPNINSVGIGYKEEGGEESDEKCISFTVDEKISKIDLPESIASYKTREIPEVFKIGEKTIRTDVIQRKYKPTYEIIQERTANITKLRHRPVLPGISVGNFKFSAGTLGAIVFNKLTCEPYILSNWHVLHGDKGSLNDPIVQPGVYDDNRNIENNVIGRLVRSHLGLAGDCAISTIEDGNFLTQILDLDVIPKRIARVDLRDSVIKSGRTTFVTHGIVKRIEVTTKIDYGGNTGIRKIGGFEIGIDQENPPINGEVSMGGDSGSLWMIKNQDNEASDIAVGLHFAGEASSLQEEHAVACKIDSVLTKLNISFNRA
jgi:endonuclease G